MKHFIHFRKQSRAFTLIELMVVIGILGVLAGLGITNYRKAQMRNAYFEEVEQISGAISGMSSLAKSTGMLMDDSNQIVQRNNSVNTNELKSVTTGRSPQCLGWRLYTKTPDNKSVTIQAEGLVGGKSTNPVTISYSKAFENHKSTKFQSGTWLEFYESNPSKKAGTTLFRIVYRPDGTPLYAGHINFSTNEKISKKKINIDIDKLGGVKVNDAIGT